MLPAAERDEIVAELAREFSQRAEGDPIRARVWLWRQVLGSAPWLARRGWRRGWTGWEAEANRMAPGGSMLESVVVDARHAARRLRRRPTYTALAVLTLALGVGGTAAVYSLVRTLLVEPLPYEAPGELAEFWMPFDWSQAEYSLLSSAVPPGVRGLAAYRDMDVTHAAPGTPAQLLQGIGVSATLLDVLGVRPALGPGFREGDDVPGAEPVVVLSHGFWQQLGGDPEIVGSTLDLGGESRTVVGVMPRGFWFPDPAVRVWLATPMNPNNRAGLFALFARVPGGPDGAVAAAALPRMAALLDEQFDYPPDWNKLAAPSLRPLTDALLGGVRPVLLSTLAAMAVILLIACANVAALMLGQVDARSTELAVRSALGASRSRLLHQVLAEAVTLGVAAGLAGALVASAAFGVLTRALPLGALAEHAALDWGVFVAAIVIALLAAVFVALVPAWSLRRADLRAALSSGRTAGIGGRGGRLEGGLVVAEVALAVLMAAGASLLIRSVANLRAIDAGVETTGVAVVDIVTGAERDGAARRQLLRELVPALEARPGIRSAAAIQKLPLRGSGDNWGIRVQGGQPTERSTTAYRIVTTGYFETIGQPLRAGRTFTAADAQGETVVVINEALAAYYFPGEDPLGRLISTGYDTTWARIIGVVGNAADGALTDPASPSRYMLMDQLPFAPEAWSLILGTERREAIAAAAEARAVVNEAAPDVAVQTTTTMHDVFDQAMGPARQLMGLLLLLAGLAIALGAIGVYGVVSHFVQRRQRDWSIRIALGLRPLRLIGQIVGRGGLLVGVGIVVGLFVSAGAMRLLASLLYGVGVTDPAALAMATATLLGIGLFAALVPAIRAGRADPATVLREM